MNRLTRQLSLILLLLLTLTSTVAASKEEVLKQCEKANFQREFTEAISYCTQALSTDPNSVQALFLRGASQRGIGNEIEAISNFNTAIKSSPQNAKEFKWRGMSFYFLLRHEEAISDFTRAIKMNPQSAEAFFYRAEAKGFNYDAIADYTRAIEIDPLYASAYSSRGVCYSIIGNREKALADYATSIDAYTLRIKNNPRDISALYGRANNNGKLKRNNEAIADYTRVIESNPSDRDAIVFASAVWLAKIYEIEELYGKAIIEYTRIIKIRPAPIYFLYRADCFAKLGSVREAVRDYQQFLDTAEKDGLYQILKERPEKYIARYGGR